MTRRKVVCIYGKFDDESDFVLEPADEDIDYTKVGKVFWIEDVKEDKKKP